MVVLGKPRDLPDSPDGNKPPIAPAVTYSQVQLPVIFAGGYMAIGGINAFLVIFTRPKIAADPHGFSEETVSAGTSLMYLGWALSSLLVMPLSDKVGRKPILYFMNIVGLVSVAGSLTVNRAWMYLIALFGTGFFPSASILGFALCQELIPEGLRTMNNGVLNVCFSLVAIVLAVTATYMTVAWSWRFETACWYFPHLFLTVCGPFVLEESPAFRKDAARQGIELSSGVSRQPQERTADRSVEAPASVAGSETGKSAVARLTGKGLRGTMLTTCFCWSATVVGYYGLSYSAGNLSDDVCLNTVLLLVVDVFSYIVAAAIVTALGGKSVQWLCFLAAGLILGALSFVPEGSPWVLVGVLCGRCCINLDFFTVFTLLMEHFPTECCSTAFGWANFTSRVAGMTAPMCTMMSPAMTFRFICTLTLLASLATLYLPDPQPKESRPARHAEKAELGILGRIHGFFKGFARPYMQMPENEAERPQA